MASCLAEDFSTSQDRAEPLSWKWGDSFILREGPLQCLIGQDVGEWQKCLRDLYLLLSVSSGSFKSREEDHGGCVCTAWPNMPQTQAKVTVHKKLKLTLFTHPHVFPNQYEFVSSMEHKWEIYKNVLLSLFLEDWSFQNELRMQKNP